MVSVLLNCNGIQFYGKNCRDYAFKNISCKEGQRNAAEGGRNIEAVMNTHNKYGKCVLNQYTGQSNGQISFEADTFTFKRTHNRCSYKKAPIKASRNTEKLAKASAT